MDRLIVNTSRHSTPLSDAQVAASFITDGTRLAIHLGIEAFVMAFGLAPRMSALQPSRA